MIDKKKEEIFNRILDICENSVIYDKKFDNNRKVDCLGIKFKVTNHEDSYNTILSYFYRENNIEQKYFSKEYLYDFIDFLIAETLILGVCIAKIFPKLILKKFIRKFNFHFERKFQEVIVYIPLYGIQMEINEIEVGNATIKTMDKDLTILLANNLENLLRKNQYFKPKNYEEEIKNLKKLILDFENKVCAVFTLFADEKTAIKIAEKECDTVLDLLQFYTYLFYHRDHKVYLGIEGGVVSGNNRIIARKIDFSDYRFNDKIIGAQRFFTISKENVKKMEKYGFLKVSEILKKSNNTLNDFQKILLIGIHWFSTYRTQKLAENQFISLMIVLEIFLSVKGEPVSNYIAENVARILYSDFDVRKKCKATIKKLYNKRSDIVHGRPEDIPDEKNFDILERVVFNLIIWMIKHLDKFGSKKDLLDYLEDKRLY